MDNNTTQLEREGAVTWTRQKDWFDPTQSTAHVNIVGVGGIGSFVGFALSKLGIPKLTLIDPDIVEAHNIPNQCFSKMNTGMSKIEAMANICDNTGGSEVKTYLARVEESGFVPLPEGNGEFPARLQGIVVSALDCMDARADLWKQVRSNIRVPLFIDARLGGENIVIYSCNPHLPADMEKYEETLHSNGEALEASCTRQSIIDVGFQVASLITRQIRLHLAGDDVDNIIYFDQATLSVQKGKFL